MRPPPLALPGVEDRVVLDQPFFVLRRFLRPRGALPPRVLVVAPLSGHFGWLMRDVVAGLLDRHEVALLEWKDAADLAPSAGRFGLAENIAVIRRAIRALGPGLTVLGASQAPVPILAATATLAAEDDPARPCALVLMGGFFDTRCRPTAVERLAAGLPEGWFTGVAARPNGLGRSVYPGDWHWLALARFLGRQIMAGGELSAKVAEDDGVDPDSFPFLRLYSTLMDLPAEFVEDNRRLVMAACGLAKGMLEWGNAPIDPATIEDVALLTVEGKRDECSGAGQTLIAHALCPRIPDALRDHVICDTAGHFGLFHGAPWRDEILPEIERFIARTADECPVAARAGR